MILTARFFLLASLGLLISLCGIFSFPYLYYGIGWEILLLLAALVDALRVDFRFLHVRRNAADRYTLLQPETIVLSFSNRGSKGLTLAYRDLPPPAFEFQNHSGTVPCTGRSITNIAYRVTPISRGSWQWGDLYAQVLGDLGLSARRKRFPLAFAVTIYPRFSDHGPFALSTQKRNYLAAKRYRQRGPGKEFESLRPYQTGDDPRNIDWKASARKDALTTRQYEVEKNQTLFLMIDCGRLMTTRIGSVGKLDYVLDSAASMAYLALDQGDFVGVMAFSSDLQFYVPPKKGLRHFRHLLEKFCVLQADPFEPDYRRTFAYFHTIQKKRALVAIYTDFLDMDSSANLIRNLQRLSAHHLPLCLTIENDEIRQILQSPIHSPEQAARKAVAWNFKMESEKVRDLLRSCGILTLHVNHRNFAQASVDKYIQVKMSGAL